jgi:hypothetical protein
MDKAGKNAGELDAIKVDDAIEQSSVALVSYKSEVREIKENEESKVATQRNLRSLAKDSLFDEDGME